MKKVNEGVTEEAARSESTEIVSSYSFLITYGWHIDMETIEERLDSINSQLPRYQVFISHILQMVFYSTYDNKAKLLQKVFKRSEPNNFLECLPTRSGRKYPDVASIPT